MVFTISGDKNAKGHRLLTYNLLTLECLAMEVTDFSCPDNNQPRCKQTGYLEEGKLMAFM